MCFFYLKILCAFLFLDLFFFDFSLFSVKLLKQKAFKTELKSLTNPPGENFYEFGKFRLDAERCVLFDGDNAVVDATPKALKILCVLVESDGRVVSKEEIISRVWADSFVEEANLSYNIFYLRRALGECAEQKFIETVPKRGYRFVAQIREAKVESRESRAENRSVFQVSDSKLQNRHSAFRNRKTLAVLSAILFIFASGAAAFLWFNSRKAESVEQIQTPKAKTNEPMSISRVTSNGKVGASAISPDGKFIAYSQNYQTGSGTLFVRQTDTNTEMQLLEPDERTFGATAFSPDGAYIYYLVFDKRNPQTALYRIPVLGGQPTRITSNINYFFTLSPDGMRAAFFRADKERKQTSIIIAATDGSGNEQIVLTFNDDEKSTDSVPAFSPDGKRLAFCLADSPNAVDLAPPRIGVYTVEIGGNGEIKKLSDEKWLGIGMMNWMPDASGVVLVGWRPRARNQIFFLSYPQGELQFVTKELSGYGNYGMGITADGTTMVADVWEFPSQIWSVGTDGETGNAVQLTANDSDGGRGLTTLPDGQIVYSSRNGFDYDLWTMRDLEGKREGKPLTNDSFSESDPVAAPDGKFVIFASDRAGATQHLFRIDADGANLKQITFGESSDSLPDISPDGKWIVYASSANNQSRIWKMPASGGAAMQLTDYESVSPSISPDGKLLAYIVPRENRVELMRLGVINFETGEAVKSFEVFPFDYNYRPPRWTAAGDALIFQKNDKPAGNLWKQSLAGGEPKQYTDFTSQRMHNYAFSRDGKRLFIARGDVKVNVVMLKNFKPN